MGSHLVVYGRFAFRATAVQQKNKGKVARLLRAVRKTETQAA